jgi:hypothetical protein
MSRNNDLFVRYMYFSIGGLCNAEAFPSQFRTFFQGVSSCPAHFNRTACTMSTVQSDTERFACAAEWLPDR